MNMKKLNIEEINKDYEDIIKRKWFDKIKNQLGFKKVDYSDFGIEKDIVYENPRPKLSPEELRQKVHSFSPIHLEDLEPDLSEYPKTTGVRVTKEPSTLNNNEKLDFEKVKSEEYSNNLNPLPFLKDVDNNNQQQNTNKLNTFSQILKAKNENRKLYNKKFEESEDTLKKDIDLEKVKNTMIVDIEDYINKTKINDFKLLVDNYLDVLKKYIIKQTEYNQLLHKYYYKNGGFNNYLFNNINIEYYDSDYDLEEMSKDSNYLKNLYKEIVSLKKERDLLQHRLKVFLKSLNQNLINIIDLDNKFVEFIETLFES